MLMTAQFEELDLVQCGFSSCERDFLTVAMCLKLGRACWMGKDMLSSNSELIVGGRDIISPNNIIYLV